MPIEFTNAPDTYGQMTDVTVEGEAKKIPVGPPFVELGGTGLRRNSGIIDEEFLPALRGTKGVKVFTEMALNDATIGALLFTIEKLLREVTWTVVGDDSSPEQAEAVEFVEQCMDDMSHSFDDFIAEVLSMLPYGWSWHEIVYKKRIGPWEKDPKKRSKHTDGLIGWRKIPIRSQETLMRWSFDESGGVRGMIQMAPPNYKQTALPIEKSLLFRTNLSKGNPEGLSLLRGAYRSWFFKKRLEEFEAIGVERDLAGMPVAKVPADFLTAKEGTPQHKTVEAFRKMVRGVRRDENEGLVLPNQYDQETKQPLYEFELMSSGGTRAFDTNSIIQRYEQRILMSVLADFILVGHESVGSYALHTDKTGIFRAALNAIVKSIADTLNRHAVPRLFELNGWKPDELPKFEPTDVDPPDLEQLASFISATAGAGMQWFPDAELEKFIRDIARLPEMTDETMEFRRQQQMQEQAMTFAQGQMGLLSMEQQAKMTEQGLTPEQAEMQANSPTPEMQQQEMAAQGQAEQGKTEQAAAQAGIQEEAAQRQFSRDKEKQALSDKSADAAHKREKEKMQLQDKVADGQHRRQIEQLRLKAQEAKKKPPPKKKGDK